MVGSFKFTLQPESVNYNHLGGALLNAVKVLKKQHYFGKAGSRSTTTSRSTELFFFLVVIMFHFFLNSFCHDCQCGLGMICFVQEPKL